MPTTPQKTVVKSQGMALDNFANIVGCNCVNFFSGTGTYKSTTAIGNCEKRKKEVKEAYENGTPIEVKDCESKCLIRSGIVRRTLQY
jgi:hypothetical protein